MTQLLLDLDPQVPPPATASAAPAPATTGTITPPGWVETPSPPPAVGDRLVDRHGRTATVEAFRDDGIDLRLDHPSNLGHGTFCGLYPPTWWRDWRKQ